MFEWKTLQLGDHANILSGFPFPSDGFSHEEGMPLIRIRDLLSGEIETYFIGPYPDEFVIGDRDILVGMDGDFNIVRWNKGEALLNQRVCKLFTSTLELDDGYLFWLLAPQLQDIHQKTPQTTVKHLSVRDLSQLSIEVPPVAEQRLIARILDTLDIQIHKTEALIAKLEKVKEGLLHDLLTRGIDESGRLRPSPEQAPELYKESPLGLIPRGWNVACLGDLLASVRPAMRSGPFGSALLKDELVESGAPLLGIDNVKVEEFSANFSRFITSEKFAELSRYAVRPNDIMITIMGTVGRCCLVPEDIGNALSSKHIWTLTLNQEKYSSYLAMLQINYMPWVINHFSRDQQGGTMSAIRSETLALLLLPVPPRHEQSEIELHLLEINKRLASEITALSKMRLEKTGLMDDLLTGRVRVTPLLEQAWGTTTA